MKSNLLIFGCDYFAIRKASELNFWHGLVRFLRYDFDEVVILSVNNRAKFKEEPWPGVTLYNVPPYYFGKTRNGSDPEHCGVQFHRLPFSIVYKTATLLRHMSLLERIIREHNVSIIHFMRVFGLLNGLLARRHPDIVFTMTVPTHIDRGFPFHYLYHTIKKLGFQGMDQLIATSQATRRRLVALGLAPEKVTVIPWSSIGAQSGIASAKQGEAIRERLRVGHNVELVLWSGPLQDTGEKEFRYALEVATSVIEKSERYHFVFAFKPNKLLKSCVNAPSGMKRVTILETDRATFDQLQRAAVVFMSPVCNRNRTIAPPLTWIEMMQNGVPVMTTLVDGVDELIEHGRNGFIADGVSETVELLMNLNKQTLESAGELGKQVTEEKYNMESIAQGYSNLWATKLQRRRIESHAGHGKVTRQTIDDRASFKSEK